MNWYYFLIALTGLALTYGGSVAVFVTRPTGAFNGETFERVIPYTNPELIAHMLAWVGLVLWISGTIFLLLTL